MGSVFVTRSQARFDDDGLVCQLSVDGAFRDLVGEGVDNRYPKLLVIKGSCLQRVGSLEGERQSRNLTLSSPNFLLQIESMPAVAQQLRLQGCRDGIQFCFGYLP